MGNVAETMQKNLIGPATSFVADPLAGLGVGGKKEAFVAKVGEPLTFVELWVRQWVDVFDKKHGTWCVAKRPVPWLTAPTKPTCGIIRDFYYFGLAHFN